jgi:hypothetical protein
VAEREHGYGRYTAGCRCDICRAAKRHRQNELREPWRKLLRAHREEFGWAPYVVHGIKHGYSGYQNFFCRCDECVEAKAVAGGTRRQSP